MDSQPPPGRHTLTPRMVVDDVAATVAFLRATFHAGGEPPAFGPAEIRIGDSLVMISAVGERTAFPAFLYVYVDDVDAVYERALAAGASSIEPPEQQAYGDRRAMVRDPFGNVYQVARPVSG